MSEQSPSPAGRAMWSQQKTCRYQRTKRRRKVILLERAFSVTNAISRSEFKGEKERGCEGRERKTAWRRYDSSLVKEGRLPKHQGALLV